MKHQVSSPQVPAEDRTNKHPFGKKGRPNGVEKEDEKEQEGQ